MRAIATLALLAELGLAGCAAPRAPSTAGNFATTLPPASCQKLVGDASAKLRALYPAANTQFEVSQGTSDAFGAGLVESLRSSGYAVREAASADPVTTAQAAPRGLPLRYIVDAPADTNLYRITLLVGSSSLSRAYMLTAEVTLQPAGAWVRKE